MNRLNTVHYLKISPKYFDAVLDGSKTFEVRFNDRDYKVGDTLCLREFVDGFYSGRELKVNVTYVLDDANYCKDGYVILGIKK